ncbi:cyclic nucleotide-binding domain-containing protein [Bradyrhizobium sp. CSA112]|uniref:Crp/Fnr family transcriptional regulator n=1 Tax=Bradyrhizobium sp. CSA112 TaxID=2699170 RepID=UPI0023B07702|nr:Crp/Fnr family transcriptional regulator [Bradyrhizobium sp. CSA112]MDE5452881.1 cyclic nucleotide-binding domain-containing protein [Bradyrhizobium sp. CSA112]
MLLQAGNVASGRSPSAAAAAAATKSTSSLLLSENQQLMGGPPSLMEKLTIREREIVLKQGRRKVLSRGQTIFSQGAKHDGIFLIESGRIRVFYSSPLGREITLAYWHAGNFVGGPEVFDTGIHQWSGVASSNCSIVQLPGKELRTLATEIPNLAIGLIEGLAFKGKCYSALAQMLGTRSITQRLAHLLLQLMDLYGVEDSDGVVIAAAFTHADLAHMVGATRQWVTISLKRMQKKRIVLTKRSQIVVCLPNILEEMRGQASD